MSKQRVVEVALSDLEQADLRDKILSLESQALDLEMVYGEIKRHNGVSKNIVAPIANKLSAVVNPRSFTDRPTQTNLKVTMEFLNHSNKYVVGGLIAILVAAMAKVVFWLIGLFTGSDSGAATASSASKVSKAVATRDRLEHNLSRPVVEEAAKIAETKNSKRKEELSKSWSMVAKDLFDEGSLYKALVNGSGICSMFLKQAESTIALISKNFSERHDEDSDEITLQLSMLTSAAKATEDVVKATSVRDRFSGVTNFSGDPQVLEDMTRVADYYRENQVAQPNHFDDRTFEKLEDTIKKKDFKSDSLSNVDLTKDLKKVSEALKDIEKKLNGDAGQGLSPRVSEVMRRMIRGCNTLVQAVNKYATLVEECRILRRKIVDQVGPITTNTVNALVQATHRVGTDKDREVIKRNT